MMNSSGKKISGYLAYAAVTAAVFALLLVSLLHKRPIESVTYIKTLMGTVVEVTIIDAGTSKPDEAAEAAFGEIKRLEKVFSSYDPDSEISRISSSAGKMVKVSPEAVEVIGEALRVARLSNGAFDPTVGALKPVWGYSGEKGVVPTAEEVRRYLQFVDYRRVIVDKDGSAVGLEKRGMVLNLGGIAKGYIVKRAVEALKRSGVRRGIIHAGGDMTVFQTGSSEPFTIGVQDPREKKLLGSVKLLNGAVATSGDYERYFIKDGVRYHHILDPATGFPANLSRSVTIVAEDPVAADALSTAVFVMGPDKGMELVEGLEKVEAVIVGSDGKVTVSKGLEWESRSAIPPP